MIGKDVRALRENNNQFSQLELLAGN